MNEDTQNKFVECISLLQELINRQADQLDKLKQDLPNIQQVHVISSNKHIQRCNNRLKILIEELAENKE